MTATLYPLPTLPFQDPVLIVATAFLVFLAVPLLFERLRIPGIIGLIVVGAAIGPNGLGILARDRTIVLLGTVGLLYLMLMVGLELDLADFARHRKRSIVFGLLSFLVPGVLGTLVALGLGYRLPSALLVGSAFSSHTLLAYPIASRLGIVRNPAVTAALGGTILTEVLALLLLAVVVRSRGGSLGPAFWAELAVPFAIYVVAVLWAVPRIGRWFFRNARHEGAAEFVFVMVALFTVSYLAHYGGVEPIVGALLAGLALNRLIPAQGPLMSRIHFVGNALFIPFFLLSVGMLVDVTALDSRAAWTFALALTFGVVLTKWAASKATERAFRWSAAEGWVVFGLSVPHAAGTLAIVLVGFDVGLLDQTEVNGVVLMILVTCLAGPWAVERWGRKVALAEERRPAAAGKAPRRILIPLANPATAGALLDLAFLLRGRDADEPLRPLMVVRGEPGRTDEEVAEAERILGHAVVQAAAADVPAIPITRVDSNIAAGIARAAAETRSTVIAIGWDGRRTGARFVFGTVLDQLLEDTRQLVVVARLTHPIAVTRRVVLVLPPAIERHPGFLEAARLANVAAAGMGASLAGLVLGDRERVAALWGEVRPALPVAWENVEGWDALGGRLEGMLRAGDLVLVLSARRGTLAWSPRLERLPDRLGTIAPEGFVVLFPPEAEAPSPAAGLSEALAPDRVVTLGDVSFVAAVGRMLAGVLDEETARGLANVVVRNEEQFSSEIVPGVVLPHVRLAGLALPLLVLGVSREGVRFPRAAEPARLIFLLVSPAEHAEEHLRYLAEIARLLSTPGKAEEILDRFAPGAALDWMHVDD